MCIHYINWARNSVGRVFALHAKSPAFESLPVHFFFFFFHIWSQAQHWICSFSVTTNMLHSFFLGQLHCFHLVRELVAYDRMGSFIRWESEIQNRQPSWYIYPTWELNYTPRRIWQGHDQDLKHVVWLSMVVSVTLNVPTLGLLGKAMGLPDTQ